MNTGLDTSVVLRLLVGEPADQAAAAWRFIAEASTSPQGAVLISDIVVGESYFALRHHYLVPHADALAALGALLADVRVRPTGSAREVIKALRSSRSGPGLLDRLIHAHYASEGANLVTFDRALRSLAGAELITP